MRVLAPLLLLAACSAGAGNGSNQLAKEGGPTSPPAAPPAAPPQDCMNGGYAEDCVPLLPAEHMRGVWVTGFEQSGFIPGATGTPGRDDVRAQDIWLTFARGATPDRSVWAQRDERGGWAAFAIEFEGRRSAGPSPNGGYGHLNGAQNLVVVDRIISLRLLPARR